MRRPLRHQEWPIYPDESAAMNARVERLERELQRLRCQLRDAMAVISELLLDEGSIGRAELAARPREDGGECNGT